MRIFKQAKWLLVALFLLSVFQQLNIITPVSATSIASSTIRYVDDWLEYVVGDMDETDIVTTDTLTMYEIGEMRVRDIKRRLQRTHGYGADEVSRMLDKRELINTLAFEEHKTRQRRIEKEKRRLLKRGIIGALISVLVVMCWPLLSHAWEAGTVNLVVFADRKKFEATRCYELQSWSGFVGIVLMAVIDLLQVWLRASVLLSWVMTSKYFFPIPSLTVHPARFMGGQVASVIGGKLAAVSAGRQVICITHLPQIAARANTHYAVSKRVVSRRTVSEIVRLSDKQRVEEIARMLGGSRVGDKARAAARELIGAKH